MGLSVVKNIIADGATGMCGGIFQNLKIEMIFAFTGYLMFNFSYTFWDA
jgi:hypothetical protein